MSITSVKSGDTGISLALENNYMEPIATYSIGAGGVSSITFNAIPQTYKHLQIRTISRGSSSNANIGWNANGDVSNANYDCHILRGNGGSVVSEAIVSGSSNSFIIGNEFSTLSTDTANVFGVGVIDILDYSNNTKNKTIRSMGGRDVNGTGAVTMNSALWMNTSSITSIRLYLINGSFAQYSRLSLYGIKG